MKGRLIIHGEVQKRWMVILNCRHRGTDQVFSPMDFVIYAGSAYQAEHCMWKNASERGWEIRNTVHVREYAP